jgi:2-oxo-3-hexenedioate decarboxylase
VSAQDHRVDAIARELVALFGTGAQAPPFSSRLADFDAREAYAVASRVRVLRSARGERAIGRKIGFTNRTVQAIYGVEGPIWNFMFDTTVRDLVSADGGFDLEGLPEPRLEPEIAFRFASEPRADMSDEALLGCVEWVAHGFEIVQSIFPGWRFAAADSIAAFGLHGAYVIGDRRPVSGKCGAWAEALRNFTIELHCDDGRILAGGGANVLGSPVAALRHLLVALETFAPGPPIKAGEIVTTGTLTDAPTIRPGETWSTRLAGIELRGLRLRLSQQSDPAPHRVSIALRKRSR